MPAATSIPAAAATPGAAPIARSRKPRAVRQSRTWTAGTSRTASSTPRCRRLPGSVGSRAGPSSRAVCGR